MPSMIARAAFTTLVLAVLSAAAPAHAVQVQRVVSPGGIEAWLVEDHTNPIIALNLAFRGGSALDPAGKEGLANMVAGLIDEGAGDLDSQTFQGKLDDLSISLSFSARLDSFEGRVRTLTDNRDTAFNLLRLALTKPRFDKEPVARIRSQIQAGLESDAEDPNSIAQRTLWRLFFPDHPYGRPGDGTKESVAGLTVDDLRGFVAHRFARDKLVIGVVGDIKPDELAGLLDKTFLDLPKSAGPIAVPDVTPQGAGSLVVVQRDIPQSIVAFGQPGIRRNDPDFYAAYVVNYILGGGGFASRLYEEVREKRGLAYSVYSYLSPLDHAALILGGVATQNGRVATSLEVIREQWRRFAEQGPTAAELKDAKTYLTGSFPLRFTSSGGISGMLVGMQLEDLGIDYLEKRNGFIEAVTLDDARRVAKRLYDEAKLAVVVVGRPNGVTANREAPDLRS